MNLLFLILPDLFYVFVTFLTLIYYLVFSEFVFKSKFNLLINTYWFFFSQLIFIHLNCLFVMPIITYNVFDNTLISDATIYLLRLFLDILFLFFLLLVKTELLKQIYNYEYLFLFFCIIFIFHFLVMSNSILLLFLCLEIYGLCIYTILSLPKKSLGSIESALKYFIFGSLSSAVLLFSFALLYFCSGCLYITELRLFFGLVEIEYQLITEISFLLILIAILFKVGSPPLHMWLVDVYSGASYIVILFLFIFSKFALLFIFSKFALNFFGILKFVNFYQYFFLFFIIISLVFGFFGTIYQIRLKKFIIFSSLFNMSFFFLFFLFFSNFFSYINFFFYYIVYSISLFVMFALFFVSSNCGYLKKLDYLNSLENSLKILALFIILIFAGIPPLSGFFGKFIFFFSLSNLQFFIFLIFFITLSFIAIFYYLRLAKLILTPSISSIFFTSSNLFLVYFISASIVSLNVMFIFLFSDLYTFCYEFILFFK